VNWTKRLQTAIRQAAEDGDVVAPTNIRAEVNVGGSNSTTATSSSQHVEINQAKKGAGSDDDSRRAKD
jgi:hypothetical protein